MNQCNRLSDRIPMVALGKGEWSPDEAQHLSDCRSCQEEWELVELTSRLGQGSVNALDPSATSRAVLQRLKQARAERLRRRAWNYAGLAAAAILVAVIWTQRPAERPGASTMGPVMAQLQIPLPELDSLQPAELDSLLQSIDESVVGAPSVEGPTPGDVDNPEVQNVLDYWEG